MRDRNSNFPHIEIDFVSDADNFSGTNGDIVGHLSVRFFDGYIYQEDQCVFPPAPENYVKNDKGEKEFYSQKLSFMESFKTKYTKLLFGTHYKRTNYCDFTVNEAYELFNCTFDSNDWIYTNNCSGKGISFTLINYGLPSQQWYDLNNMFNNYINIFTWVKEEDIDVVGCYLRKNKRFVNRIKVTPAKKLSITYKGEVITFDHIKDEQPLIKVLLHKNGLEKESIWATKHPTKPIAITRNHTLFGIPWGTYIPIDDNNSCNVPDISGKMVFNQKALK